MAARIVTRVANRPTSRESALHETLADFLHDSLRGPGSHRHDVVMRAPGISFGFSAGLAARTLRHLPADSP